jgi:ABC-type amino acid transport system permease subunit
MIAVKLAIFLVCAAFLALYVRAGVRAVREWMRGR